jgi:hypothetical protein
MSIRTGLDAKYADYPLWLFDSKRRGLGLKVCDSSGKATVRPMRRTSYPRSTLRVNSGTGKWTDLQPPFGQITKNIFSGGLGMKDSEADQTKYWFGSGVWTPGAGGVMLAPAWYRAQTAWPIKKENRLLPTDTVVWKKLEGTFIACQITIGAADLVVAGIRLPIRSTGNPGGLLVEICSNSAVVEDHPNTVISGTQVTSTTVLLSSGERNFVFTTPVTLTATVKYWVLIHFHAGATDHDYSEYIERASDFIASTSPDGSTWTSGATSFVFTLLTATDIKDAYFFTYKQACYCWMTDSDATGTVHLFVNGDVGLADSNAGALTTLVDATKAWTFDQFAGAIVRIYTGAGAGEWRIIEKNSATVLTVTRPWVTTHDADTTCYVILGSKSWTEITGHGLAAVSSAVAGENNGTVYFAQGSDAASVLPIRKMRGFVDPTGDNHWDFEYDADDAGGADLLVSAYDQEKLNVIWRARNGATNNDVAMAPQVAWPTDLTFETAIMLGSKEQDISGLFEWGNKIGVICMNRMWALLNKVPDKVTKWMSTWDKNIGRHPVLMSSYVVFPKGNNLMRLVGDLLEDFGPENTDGLPKRYSGQWVDLWSEEGILYAAKRSGSLITRAFEPCGESGVYLYHGGGWHPVVHLDIGTSMYAMHRQVMDNKHDMLYMATRDTIFYCYIPRAFDYRQDIAFWDDLHVSSDGVLLLGKITADSETLDKWWSSINLYGVDLHTAYNNVEVYYRTTEPVPTAANGYAENLASDWTYLGEAYADPTTGTSTVCKIVAQIKSKQLWLLLRLKSEDGKHTPILQAITVDYMAWVDSADVWPVSFRLDDFAFEVNGTMTTINSEEAQKLLDEWSRDPAPLTMESTLYFADQRSVHIERPNYQIMTFDQGATTPQGREAYYGTMNIMESGVELYRRPLGSGRSWTKDI